jgi:two-component system, chemotaxis family, sensor kinase Cph1
MPEVRVDRVRFVEVFQNLIENAIKFTRDVSGPTIEMGMREDATGRVFFVKDNGIGIPPRFHETVFGLFDKLDPKSEGSGVGLAVVKRIVEVHGGRIWIESDGEGRGTAFCFTLP